MKNKGNGRSCWSGRTWSLVVSVAMLVLGACSEPSTTGTADRELPSTTLSLLEVIDGSNPQGNPHFRFLLPLNSALGSFGGVFDGTQDPVVEVCGLLQSSCDPATLQRFTTNGSGSGRVRIDPDEELYILNWRVASGGRFRITVRSGGVRLGHIDLNLSGEQTIPVKFRIEEGAANLAPFSIGLDVPAAARSKLVTVASIMGTVRIASWLIATPRQGVPSLIAAQDVLGNPFLLGFASSPSDVALAPSASLGSGDGVLDAQSTALGMVKLGLTVGGRAAVELDASIRNHPRFAPLIAAVTADLEAGLAPLSSPSTTDLAAAIAADLLTDLRSQVLPAAAPIQATGNEAGVPIGKSDLTILDAPIGDPGATPDLLIDNATFIYWGVRSVTTQEDLIDSKLVSPRPLCWFCWPPFFGGESKTLLKGINGPLSVLAGTDDGDASGRNVALAANILMTGLLQLAGLPVDVKLSTQMNVLISAALDVNFLADVATALNSGDPAGAVTTVLRWFRSNTNLLTAIATAAFGTAVSNAEAQLPFFLASQIPVAKVVRLTIHSAKGILFFSDWMRSSPDRVGICQFNNLLQDNDGDCAEVKITCDQGHLDTTPPGVGFFLPGVRLRCYVIRSDDFRPVAGLWSISPTDVLSIESGDSPDWVWLIARKKGIATLSVRSDEVKSSAEIKAYVIDFSGEWVSNNGTLLARLNQDGSSVWGAYFQGGQTYSVLGEASDCLGYGFLVCLAARITPGLDPPGSAFTLLAGFLNPGILDPAALSYYSSEGVLVRQSGWYAFPGQCPAAYLEDLLTRQVAWWNHAWIPCIYGPQAAP